MSVFNLELMGRWGNQLFQWAFAKAFCEQHGLELHAPEWIGQRIFGRADLPPLQGLSKYNDLTIANWSRGDVSFCGYAQMQRHMIYTRAQCREWFQFNQCSKLPPRICAHRRVGDYASCGYVVVSKPSYWKAAKQFGYDPDEVRFITDEFKFGDDWLNDFLTLMRAPVLFRGNSTFSWWAATLGHGRVFSPVIEGAEGGKEQDVLFVEGNYPRFIKADNVEDLYLKE